MAGKRRGQGEGSVRQRPNGRWQAQISIEGYRLSHTEPTKTAALKWLRAQQAKVDEGTLTAETGRVTVGQVLDRWLAAAAVSVKPKTFKVYTDLVRLHLAPAFARTRVVDLRPDRAQAFYRQKLDGGLSPRSVEFLHRVLHRALSQGVRWELVMRPVTAAVTPPRPRRPEIHVWHPSEVRCFLEGLSGDRLEALYTVALFCGLRQGELLGLKWEDLDLASGRLHVRRTLQRINCQGIVVGEPKTARGRRQIALARPVVAALQRWQALQVTQREFAGEKWRESGFVFTSNVGTALEARSLQHDLARRQESLGLPRIRFHDLRHTCATMLLSDGVHPKVVQELLGHSSVTITLDTYSHVLPTMQENAAKAMEKLLQREEGPGV